MANLAFGANSILNVKQFSWVFLVDLITMIFAVLFIIFYLDRAAGWIISQIVGWFLWKKYKLYFKVGSIKFSLYGGRIFFKNLVYIGDNQAISVLHGNFNWRYWFSRVRRNGWEYPDEDSSLPCRNKVELYGFEWFLYNRAEAYKFEEAATSDADSDTTVINPDFEKGDKRLIGKLPVELEMTKFNVYIGNKSTSSLLIASSDHGTGIVDAKRSASPCDRYKLVYSIKLNKPSITLCPNDDYAPRKPQTSVRSGHWFSMHEIFGNFIRKKHKLAKLRSLKNANKTPRKSKERIPMMECSQLSVDYYYDVPGLVSEKPYNPPEFGYDIKLKDAQISYGPETERKRTELFQAFFPQNCHDARPHTDHIGQLRTSKQVVCNIEFIGQLTLRIPFTDFQNANANLSAANQDGAHGTAWLELVASERSRIETSTDVVAFDYGFHNIVSVQLFQPVIRTSVNHAEFLSADNATMKITQKAPLQWNGLQTWDFNLLLDGVHHYYLREHTNLIVDLTEDLRVGPPVVYNYFIPTIYNVEVQARNYNLYLNVNKQNIIDNPVSKTENTFLHFKLPELSVNAQLPLDQVVPVSNTVDLTMFTPYFTMDVSTPTWHTLEAFAETLSVGSAHNFTLKRKYTYYAETDFTKIETQVMDLHAEDFTLIAHGYVVDYLMEITNNYGGVDYKFQTPEEFFSREKKAPEVAYTRPDIDLDIRLNCLIERGCFVMPAYLYSCRDNLSLHFDTWAADLRFTNYYMDLQTEFSPVRGYHNRDIENALELGKNGGMGEEVIFTEELIARAHRMFGLPPAEPTYICKWNFEIADFIVSAPADFLLLQSQIATCFSHGIKDNENRPLIEPPKIWDITFLAADISSVSVRLRAGTDIVRLQTSAVKFSFNDINNDRFSDKSTINIPSIRFWAECDNKVVVDISTSLLVSNFGIKAHPDQAYENQQSHVAQHDTLFHRCPFFLDDEHRDTPEYQLRYEDRAHITPQMPIPSMPPQLTRETLLIIDSELGHYDYKGKDESESGSSVSIYGSSGDSSLSSSSTETLDSGYGKPIFKVQSRQSENWKVPHNREKSASVEPMPIVEWMPGSWKVHTEEDDRIYENTVIETGKVNVDADIKALGVVQSFYDAFNVINVEGVLDEAQVKLVQALMDKALKKCSKFYFAVPEVMFNLKNKRATLFAEIANIKAILDIYEQPTNTPKLNLSLIMDKLVGGIKSRADVATCQIFNPQAWYRVAKNDTADSDIKCSSIDFTIDSSQIPVLGEFIAEFMRTPFSLASSVKDNLEARVFYSLVECGDRHAIVHDSYVLTRPSGPVQAKNFIRTNPSWRILVRLRYLLKSLPPESLVLEEKLPDDAKRKVIKILEKWRSWERSEPLQDAKIFQVFDENFELQKLTKLFISIENFSAVIKYGGLKEDYFILDYFHTRAEIRSPKKDWYKCHSASAAQKARLSISWEILNVVDKILTVVDNLPKNHDERAQPDDSEVGKSLVLQTILSLTVNDSSGEVRFENFTLECQSKGTQISGTVDFRDAADTLFCSGVYLSENAAIRIHSPSLQLEIADNLFEGLSTGFAMNLKNKKGPLWLSAQVSNLLFSINSTTAQLCKCVELFVEQDLKGILALLQRKSSPDQSEPVPSPRNRDETPLGIHFNLNMRVLSFTFKVKVINDLLLSFSGAGFTFRVRQPDKHALLCDLDWKSYVFKVAHANKKVIGSFLVEGTKLLCRADMDERAVDVKYAVERVNLETTSTIILLRYLQSQTFKDEVSHTRTMVDNLLESSAFKPKPKPVRQDVEPIHDPKQLYINAFIRMKQIRIALPVDDLSFELVFDNVKARHDSYTWETSSITPIDKICSMIRVAELSANLLHEQKSEKLLSIELLGSCTNFSQKKSFHLTSDFCNTRISPFAVYSIFMAVNKVKMHAGSLLSSSSGARTSEVELNLDFLNDLKLAIALRNFALTWATDSAQCEEGATVGFELLQINLLHQRCRMDLKGFHIIAANENWATMKGNEAHNYAHLPHVEISAVFLKKDRFLDLSVRGESLELNVKPNMGQLIAALIQSADRTQNLLKKAKDQLNLQVPDVQSEQFASRRVPLGVHLNGYFESSILVLWDDQDVSQSPALEVRSPAISIRCDHTHSRASKDNIYLIVELKSSSNTIYPKSLVALRTLYKYSLDLVREPVSSDPSYGNESPESPQSPIIPNLATFLEPGSPVLEPPERHNSFSMSRSLSRHGSFARHGSFSRINTNFKSQKLAKRPSFDVGDSSPFQDAFKPEETEPEVTKLEESKPKETEPEVGAKSKETEPEEAKEESSIGEALTSLISRFNIELEVHIGSQELTVSCLPYSKIAAGISTDAVHIYGLTPQAEDQSTYVGVSGVIRNARIALQHAHSREITGFGNITNIGFVCTQAITSNLFANPLQVGLTITKSTFEIKAEQIRDLQLFVDIWNPKVEMASDVAAAEETKSSPSESSNDDVRLVSKYEKLLSRNPMSFLITVEIAEGSGTADLGNSIGRTRINLNRWWCTIYRKGAFSQVCNKLDKVVVSCEGRVGGTLSVGDIRSRLSVYWPQADTIPLVQAVLTIDSILVMASLDSHTFLCGEVRKTNTYMMNHRELIKDKKHSLETFAEIGVVNIACTALIASHLFDIRDLFDSVHRQVAIYDAISDSVEPSKVNVVLDDYIAQLCFSMNLQIGEVEVTVFPSTFNNESMLGIHASTIGLSFSQNQLLPDLRSDLALVLFKLKIGVTTGSSGSNRYDLEPNELLTLLGSLPFTNILVSIPETRVKMGTYDDLEKQVAYTFTSRFGGSVEVGWNLGTVDFIREISESHKIAWNSRIKVRPVARGGISKGDLKIEKPSDKPKPEYMALEAPIIEMPKLHDMGEATPPVEWFGLNRQKLPGATHWYIIRGLNDLTKDVEKIYAHILG